MQNTPHTHTHPGKRVRLKMRDGTSVEGKFIEKTGNGFIVLDVEGEPKRYRANGVDKFILVKTARTMN
jgi:hypothetical protein